ncbi:MAG TPA: hypothetical protein VEC12_10065 [Bacteroidia bacterium]|nr:hypothetical protein [Bacteroidia bacterium]
MTENIGIGSRIRHTQHGDGVVINVKSTGLMVTFIKSGYKEIPHSEEIEVVDDMVPDTDMVSMYEVERSLSRLLQKWTDITESTNLIGEKWTGGKMILQPGRKDLAVKEVPIEQFFHKIVMLRDRLRTLEQKVNSSNLPDEAKIDIQQYITRCYGSLTTFNVFFKHPHDQFVGDKGKE